MNNGTNFFSFILTLQTLCFRQTNLYIHVLWQTLTSVLLVLFC